MNFRRASFFIFGSRTAAFVLQASGGLLVARLLGPAGRGELALLFLLPTIIAMVLGLGIGTSNAYFASHATRQPAASQVSSGTRFSIEQLYYNSLWLGALFGFAGTIIIIAAEEWVIDTFVRGVSPDNMRLAMMTVPLLLYYNFFQGLAQGSQRYRIYNGVVVLRPFFFLFSFLFVFILFGDGLKAGLWAYSLCYVVPVLWLVIDLRPRRTENSRLSGGFLKAQIRIGLPSYIAELLGYLFFRVSLLLIGYFLDGEQAGYFAIVVLIAESLWFLSNSVSAALLPEAAGRSMNELRLLVPKVVRHVVFLTACGAAVLFIIDGWLIGLAFGKDFLPAVSPLHWLYPGIIAASAAKVFASYLLSQGRPHLTAMIGGLGMIANIILGVWLIPLYGIRGAAIAASCSYILMTLLMGIRFVWETHAPVSRLFLLSREDFQFYRNTIALFKTRARFLK